MALPITMLTAEVKTQWGSNQLCIDVANCADLAFTLDCNTDHKGNRAFMELPRRYQTVRGAKQAAARLMGEPLDWKETAEWAELHEPKGLTT